MKLNKLFLLAAMGLGLFACNNNDLVEGSGPNGTQEEGTTYVGFTLKFNDANTRAEEPGTEAEQKINSVYVLVADGDNVITIGSLSAATDAPIESGKTKVVFATKPGPHDFYVVVNPTTAPTTSNTVSEYFNTGVAIGAEEFAKTTAGSESFLMASVKKETFDIADGVTEKEALAGTDATANNFTINVERVAAKVTMTCESTTLTSANNNAGGTITYPEFTLKGGATMSYRMAQSAISEITGNAWTYTSSSTDVYVKKETDDNNIYRNATPVYCLENLHATGSYKQDNTTYLTLNTTFKPANVVNCDNPLSGLTSNNHTKGTDDELTFYVVKEGTLAGNYLMKADLLTWQKTKHNITEEQFKIGEISKNPAHFPAGVESISDEYINGKCFFGPIWIGQTDTDKDNAPIVRNTWYNLKITGIALPGDPQPPQPDPGQPLVPGTNVAITLDVMPWNFINREIDLQ